MKAAKIWFLLVLLQPWAAELRHRSVDLERNEVEISVGTNFSISLCLIWSALDLLACCNCDCSRGMLNIVGQSA